MNVQLRFSLCPFCQGIAVPVYRMGVYDVLQCAECGTGQVNPMPTEVELQKFYKHFLFGANIRNREIISKSAPKLFSQLGLIRGGGKKMLDVGGGGGFYAKTFEEYNYGESTYVDLDKDACGFAKDTVGLMRVLNQDVTRLDVEDERYDFIMCRHLIEHLVDPTGFILKMIDILAHKGTLLIVCPNGDSLEYFAYPNSNLRSRIKKISAASHLSRLKVMAKLFSGEMLHGIDPPRHLWAISRKGMRNFLASKNIKAEITTFPLTDLAYSPYHSSPTFYHKIWAVVGDMITSRIAGGTHLSVVIRKAEHGQVF